ncbi:uncharacterized protein E0L32_002433 [Thyridium curvatum]|uniref:Peptidase C45 hydrolase domain-containing protein n=1 Tax=Thyridium curvatum TaxID=1093900 RepID=A0A507BGU1_9PEZI|nr:uncharacterized protein E0L32_002433 [Thyridium curvatum]TPX18576.1 hypothetical protein E0L32_002433 [Thyridium curvatum]
MLEVRCSGTPYEIGHQHGASAKKQVHGSLAFYRQLFKSTCSMEWDDVTREAATYVNSLESTCPQYLDELRGLAAGAEAPFLDILALNVRTEITFGLFTENAKADVKLDGCTSLGFKKSTGESYLCQNWDWQVEQSPNIFLCRVSQPGTGLPDFAMVTEGGLIGKIGMNANGVGVCLNAIRARGLDRSKLPVHFALRKVLESSSRAEAIQTLKSLGVAGSAHILVSDATGSTGLECTSIGIKELQMDADGVVVHANHLLLDHPGVDEPGWLPDSSYRVTRLQALLKQTDLSGLDFDSFFELFKDEDGFPGSINRCQQDGCATQTLFTILMNLAAKRALITFGRPSAFTDRVEVVF